MHHLRVPSLPMDCIIQKWNGELSIENVIVFASIWQFSGALWTALRQPERVAGEFSFHVRRTFHIALLRSASPGGQELGAILSICGQEPSDGAGAE
jgi:hypothetical protein